MPKVNDKYFVLFTLAINLLATLLMIRSRGEGFLATIGFTLLAISVALGLSSCISMFIKIIGTKLPH